MKVREKTIDSSHGSDQKGLTGRDTVLPRKTANSAAHTVQVGTMCTHGHFLWPFALLVYVCVASGH